jgi:diguanylate cyclase (GGDEF)-like protein
MFGKTPTEYREIGLYTDLFPKIRIEFSKGGKITVKNDMNIDIIIEELKSTKEGYYLDIDIDEFGSINEKYGFKAGDKILETVPKRIKDVLKNENIKTEPVRINGDEFGLIIKNIEKSEVEKISKKIVNSMNESVDFEGEKIKFTISIGIDEFNIGKKEETVLKNGTQAMIEAKKKGKNTYFIK